jgi:tryptophan-rich sensory protein
VATISRRVPRSRDALGLAGFLALAFGVMVLGGTAAGRGMAGWYPQLHKPRFTPPGWVFGPVWTVLYPTLAIAGWRVWREHRSPVATLLFLVQLALNAAWPWLFFVVQRLDLAFFDSALLLAAALATTVAFCRVHRGAALLLVPYVGWLAFAAILTHAVWQLNR